MNKHVLPVLLIFLTLAEPSSVRPSEPAKELKGPTPKPSGNIAVIGLDSRWQSHGLYLNGLLEKVQAGWKPAAQPNKSSAQCIVSFRLTSKGEVNVLRVKDIDAGRKAVTCCLEAITGPAPYPAWTDAMMADLGSEQTLSLAFYFR